VDNLKESNNLADNGVDEMTLTLKRHRICGCGPDRWGSGSYPDDRASRILHNISTRLHIITVHKAALISIHRLCLLSVGKNLQGRSEWDDVRSSETALQGTLKYMHITFCCVSVMKCKGCDWLGMHLGEGDKGNINTRFGW